MPEERRLIFPAEAATLNDTWHSSGLCGTGSGEMVVSNLRVPRERAVSYDAPVAAGTLYAFPFFGLLALGIAAVALGNARGAIEDLVELAGGKLPLGSRRTLAERHSAQSTLAVAEAQPALRARLLLRKRSTKPGRSRVRAAPSRCGTARRFVSPRRMRPARRPMWRAACTISAAARRSSCPRRCSAAFATDTSPPSTSWSRRRPDELTGRVFNGPAGWIRPRRCKVLRRRGNRYTPAPASASARHARSGFPAGCRGRG